MKFEDLKLIEPILAAVKSEGYTETHPLYRNKPYP